MSRFILFIVFLTMMGCTKQRFSTPATKTGSESNALKTLIYKSCAIKGSVNPQVDILVLIDNSTSTNFITSDLKNAIIDSLQSISQDFDYRIYVAPLMAPATGENLSSYPHFSGAPSGSTPLSPPSSLNSIYNLTFGSPAVGADELGFRRIDTLLNTLHTPTSSGGLGFFRSKTHDITILISNGNDSDGVVGGDYYSQNFNLRKQELLNRKIAIESQQFRLLSLVAHSACRSGHIRGFNYIRMSKELYALSGDTSLSGVVNPDSFDLCLGDFSNIFSQINKSIQPISENLTYRYWPIESELKNKIIAGQVNPANLDVFFLDDSSNSSTLVPQSNYNYMPNFSGNIVDPAHVSDILHTGAALALSPSAYVTTPDCLLVQAPEEPKYYGYIRLATEPKESTIKVSKNGNTINKDATNGWEYIGFQSALNVLIASPTNHNPSTIWTDIKTGYFIKLNGSAIYGDGENLEVTFLKAPIE